MNKDFKIALILTVVVIGFGVPMLSGQTIPGFGHSEERTPEEQREIDDYLGEAAILKYNEAKEKREMDLSFDNLGVATQYGLTRLTEENTRLTEENTRQTAENTRWIFWVLFVGVIELGCLSSFLMFKKR